MVLDGQFSMFPLYGTYTVFKLNCDKSRLAIYIKVFVLVVLLPRDQKKANHSLSPSNK